MSLYDFKCEDGHVCELEYSMSNVPDCVQCPTCAKSAKRVYSAPSIRFIGPGFHNTDYGQGKKHDGKPTEQPTPQEAKEKADAGKGGGTKQSA